jgi:hypothetical protein
VGQLAARVLRPGGVLAAFPGHSNLPSVTAILGQHLAYRWTCALVHCGAYSSRGTRILTRWAPLLLYSKGKFNPPLHVLDLVQTHDAERDRHRWQRPLEEFAHFSKYLTRPGDWVLDPMAGSFVSGKAATRLGRNYIGVDIDRTAVKKGRAFLGV